MCRRFALVRYVDPSGVSGTGVVAYGVRFADGCVALRWESSCPATSLWVSLSDLLAVHGHDGATVVQWIDAEATARPRDAEATPRRLDAEATPRPQEAAGGVDRLEARHRKPARRDRRLAAGLVAAGCLLLLL